MKPLVLLLLNTLSLLGALIVNYTAGTGSLGGQSVGEVSAKYPTLLTPAGYAFSIWGIIYLLLIAFTVYQWVSWSKGRSEESLTKSGVWFFLANLANALWVIAWTREAIGLSVLLMLLLLFCLIRLVVRLGLEVWDAPLRIIAFVWWPVCIYIGWIVLATLANVSAYLKKTGVLNGLLSPELWAILGLVLAAGLYLFLTWTRNMREAALVGVWGLSAITYRHWSDHEAVAITALVSGVVLFLSAGYHAYRNKDSSPFARLKKEA